MIIIKYLGIQEYCSTYKYMKDYTLNRNVSSPDQMLLLEHYNVFTKGKNEINYTRSKIKDIPVVQTDRGGKTTFHGPGQAIIYLLIDIAKHKISVKNFISIIEMCAKTLLNSYGLKCDILSYAPGIFYKEKKIASIGFRIKKGKTYHGISINNNIDLTPFSFINPCGYKDIKMTKLSHYDIIVNTKDLLYSYQDLIRKIFY